MQLNASARRIKVEDLKFYEHYLRSLVTNYANMLGSFK